MKKFENPYPQNITPPPEMSRLNADIYKDHYSFIRRIRTERGTVQTTINILFKKLVDELIERNITSYTDEREFLSFVVNSRLALPGETVRGTIEPVTEGKTPNGDDRTRAEGVREAGQPAPHESARDAERTRRGKVPGKGQVQRVK